MISTLLWLTFTAAFGVTVPTVALAWQNSPHEPGTNSDADFWLLIQNCSMAATGIVLVTVPLWHGSSYSLYTWFLAAGFSVAGVLCAIAAPVMYTRVPTEWSAFLAIVAQVIQAFLTLQLSLVARNGDACSEKGTAFESLGGRQKGS